MTDPIHTMDNPVIEALLRVSDPSQIVQRRFAAEALLASGEIPAILKTESAAPGGLMISGDLVAPDVLLDEVFASLSLERELATGRRDRLGRFDENSLQWDVSQPWVDLCAAKIVRTLADRGISLPPRSQRFRVVISHDIDHTTGFEPTSLFKSLCRTLRLRHGSALPLANVVSRRALVKNLERLLDFEVQQGIHSHFFMLSGPYGLGRHSSRTDIRWRCSREIATMIQRAGMTIGLHGSFYAAERNLLQRECKYLEDAIGLSVTSHRNHYLHFDTLKSPAQIEAAGIRHDFSVGFITHIGFRAGSAKAYQIFDLLGQRPSRVISVPLLYMDTPRLDESPEHLLDRLRAVLIEAKGVSGCVSLLFHPDMFLIDDKAWGFFEQAVCLCRELDADLSGELPQLQIPANSERINDGPSSGDHDK